MGWKRKVSYMSELRAIQIAHRLFEKDVWSTSERMSRLQRREMEMHSLLVDSFYFLNLLLTFAIVKVVLNGISNFWVCTPRKPRSHPMLF